MDIQIGWQVSGQQDGKLADTHVYVYMYVSNCQHADLPLIQGLSYILYCIYNYLYGYKEVLTCIRTAGIRSTCR